MIRQKRSASLTLNLCLGSTYYVVLTCLAADLEVYTDGSSAVEDIKVGGKLEGRYEVVTGDASINAGVQKQFSENYQYGLFTFYQNLLQVDFDDFKNSIDEQVMGRLIQGLDHFNGNNPDVVAAYKQIFTLLGSHIITRATYGSRLNMVSSILRDDIICHH